MKDAIIQQITEKTATNDHTGALITLARAMGQDGHAKTLEALKIIHHNIGHMPYNLIEFRSGIANELLIIVKRESDQETYAKIMGAF